ncbi:hypothetical protein CHS0354_016366 [Potamilus streckersoni]|uniref:Ubiquitin-like domain-containing protein n=1 Tax=Potamilus streckersoni TaxID=2493646 RepID=A0AAE0SVQ8_9BIVA|nr:hypothetical protein CHS0354_016366 [Potamilus streckersoni]
MIIYVENKAFPNKTFIVVVKEGDRVARIRAHLLHILFEIGREEHQFRLRYNGQFLRDAFVLEDYGIKTNSVVKMVPMSNKQGHDSYADMRSVSSSLSMSFDKGGGQPPPVKAALYSEIKHLNRRERLLSDLKVLLYLHFMFIVLAVMTTFPYAGIWCAVYVLVGWYLLPEYTRLGGFIGNTFHLRYVFCFVFGTCGLGIFAVGLYFASVEWMSIVKHGCSNMVFSDACSSKNVYTAVFFTMQAPLLLLTTGICAYLLYNFTVETGDLIEQTLVQERDIEEVMLLAKSNKLKDKRTAAYELSTMAATGDDNKFKIVAEGGLNVLMDMSMSSDESTKEHAVEALAELITIPSIQDNFVEMGGVRNFTALLHSSNSRIVQEAASALYIICQNDDNRHSVVADHGLNDLSHAAQNGTILTQRTVASIFLELAFSQDIRTELTSRNIPVQALVELSRSNDPEILQYSLQTLELLAIESADVLFAQEDLLEVLMELPQRTVDERMYTLVGKILLYFAENQDTCKKMQDHPCLRETLTIFAHTKDSVLQKVAVKIIFCMMDTKELKMRTKAMKLDRILSFIRDNSADRDAWDMADQGIEVMMNDSNDNFPNLPSLSTIEKLNKMGGAYNFGSRTSLRSDSGSCNSEPMRKK